MKNISLENLDKNRINFIADILLLGHYSEKECQRFDAVIQDYLNFVKRHG